MQLAAPSLSKFEKFTKQFRIFDLPFMFKNINAVDEFQSSATGQAMKESMTKRGLCILVGATGSGKSTLVACLSGLLRPDEGQVTALGQDLWNLKTARIDRFRLDHCGFIFQGFNLFSALSALDQVTTVLKHTGLSKDEARQRARRAAGRGAAPSLEAPPTFLPQCGPTSFPTA